MDDKKIRRSTDVLEQARQDSAWSADCSLQSSTEKFSVEPPTGQLWNTAGTALTPVASRTSQMSRQLSRYTTHGTTMTSDPSFEVDFDDDDPDNPRNWSTAYKTMLLFCLSISTLLIVLYSTSYTAAIPAMMDEFGIHDQAFAFAGLTTYLLGLAVGSVVLAPISETFGRKPVYMIALFIFFILIIPCTLANNLTTIIVIRFFGALAGSCMIANAPGTIGDIVSDEYRAVAFSVWSIGPMNGPVFGPIFGGFVTEYLSWRWANWIILIIAFGSFVSMCAVKETYTPVLLQRKAARRRQTTGDRRYWSRFDVKLDFWALMRVNLSRPFIMAVKEPICIFWNVYISLLYGILYLCFSVYPIIYHEERGWSLGVSALGFCGIGVGITLTICLASPIKKMINAHRPDATGRIPPESMMSVVCIAACLCPIGELWFAWTCLPTSIHPAVSIAAGIPFGAGNAGVFIYASNYLVGSYGIYAASALAGNSVIRSVLGGTLPLAGPAMYRAMGAHWAGAFLGLLEVIMIPIPFIFYKYGHKIREQSSLIRQMREIEEKQETKRKRSGAVGARSPDSVLVAPGPKDQKRAEMASVQGPVTNSAAQVVPARAFDLEKQVEAKLSAVGGLTQEMA